MTDEEIRVKVAQIANRSDAQSKFLYELCDKNLAVYLNLEAIIQTNYYHCVPADKETLLLFLNKTKLSKTIKRET